MTSELERVLASARQHARVFRRRVAEQEALVAALQANGRPAEDALKLLVQFKEALRRAEDHREPRGGSG